MNSKDIFAVGLIALLALAVSLSTLDSPYLFTLESYSHALNVEKAVKGEAVGGGSAAYYLAASFAYSRAAAFTGAKEFDPALLVTVLKVLAALFAAVTGIGAYYALRPFCSREMSAVGSIMLFTSLAATGMFVGGFVSPGALGLAALMCGVAFLLQGIKRKQAAFAAGGGVLAVVAMLAWSGAVIAFIAVLVGLVAQAAFNERRKERKREFLLCAAAFGVIGLVGAGMAGFSAFSGGIDALTELSFLLLFAPIVLLALFVAIVKAVGGTVPGDYDVFALAFGIASVAGGLLSPAAALPGLALLAGYALEDMAESLQKRKITLFVAGCGTAFAAFIMLIGFVPWSTAAVMGCLIGFGGAFGASMSRDASLPKYVAWAFAFVLVVASTSSALLLAQSQQAPVMDEMKGAVGWIARNAPADATIAVVGQDEMYAFMAQRKVVSAGVADWMLGNGSGGQLSALGADYVIIDMSAFDSLEYLKNKTGKTAVRMDSFGFAGFRSDPDGTIYGAFISQANNIAYIPYDERAGFVPSGEVIMVEPSGNTRKVPFARFSLMKSEDGKIARAIYPYDNYDVNLFKAFFGTINGLEKVYPEGDGTALVFGVRGA